MSAVQARKNHPMPALIPTRLEIRRGDMGGFYLA